MKQVVLFVFSCVLERRTPYLFSTALILSIFVFVIMSGKWKEWEKGIIRILSLECMLKNFKRGFN
jgi:hypothetical protein